MNSDNIAVRNSVQQALLSLMQDKNISEISVTELIKWEEVGRMSFYWNYATKEDIVLDAFRQQTMPIIDEIRREGRPTTTPRVQDSISAFSTSGLQEASMKAARNWLPFSTTT